MFGSGSLWSLDPVVETIKFLIRSLVLDLVLDLVQINHWNKKALDLVIFVSEKMENQTPVCILR